MNASYPDKSNTNFPFQIILLVSTFFCKKNERSSPGRDVDCLNEKENLEFTFRFLWFVVVVFGATCASKIVFIATRKCLITPAILLKELLLFFVYLPLPLSLTPFSSPASFFSHLKVCLQSYNFSIV
jgi:hypothetical protein